ncbi:unnamed protein product, partial [Didymodactylos carnosus]
LVYGVPEDKNENTTDTILDMCQSINVNIKQSDISTSHRLGKPKSDRNRPIIFRLIRYDDRNHIFNYKKKLKDVPKYKSVLVVEDLTKYNMDLFKHARQILGNKSIYTLNGHIWCKTKDGRVSIRCLTDIGKVKNPD